MLLLFCLLNVFQALFRVKQLFKNIGQRSATRLDSCEWQGVWNSMGKCLGWWASLAFLNFIPKQVQNPEKRVEYLEEVCCHPGNFRETQIIAVCWGLAHAYQALFNTARCSQGEEEENKPMGMAAASTPTNSNPHNRHCSYSNPHCIIKCQKIRSNMPCSWMGPVAM